MTTPAKKGPECHLQLRSPAIQPSRHVSLSINGSSCRVAWQAAPARGDWSMRSNLRYGAECQQSWTVYGSARTIVAMGAAEESLEKSPTFAPPLRRLCADGSGLWCFRGRRSCRPASRSAASQQNKVPPSNNILTTAKASFQECAAGKSRCLLGSSRRLTHPVPLALSGVDWWPGRKPRHHDIAHLP
jgi:hypothetical protein